MRRKGRERGGRGQNEMEQEGRGQNEEGVKEGGEFIAVIW